MANIAAMSDLTLSEWRAQAGKTLAETAARLGLGGSNPARTLQRYERGERPCPLAIASGVETLTGGAVSSSSFHRVREDFLAAQAQGDAAVIGGGGSGLAHDGENAADAATCPRQCEPAFAEEPGR